MSTSKKVTKKSSVVPFNKKNTLALADRIYSDKGGVVSFLKLCNGELSDGKDGGRTLHCAVGEAYYHFVDPQVANLKEDTTAAIYYLTDVAQLKSSAIKEDLEMALNKLVSTNDSANKEDFLKRSIEVADFFRKEVAPLLK